MNTEPIPFVDLKAQYWTISDEVNSAISEVVENTSFILGKPVQDLEEAFAKYCSVSYAIGVDSGTSALHLALLASGVGPGDEVITTANTFIATALAISYTGARPVLVDVDPETYTIDVQKFRDAITSQTKAVIPVHLYGHPADMYPLLEIAEENNLIVIEDACQAHGARYFGERVGSLGKAAAFSFYPAKNLGAFGDGGMVVTDDPEVADTIRILRDVGQKEKYHHLMKGFNHRLDALQAAVLKVKLPHLDRWNEARRLVADQYNQLFDRSLVATPVERDNTEHVYHLYVIRVEDRDGLRKYLGQKNIYTGIHYPIPIHLQHAYKDLGYRKGDFPISETCADHIVSLPMYPELSSERIEQVVRAVHDYCRH